jgi:hypothetical protein
MAESMNAQEAAVHKLLIEVADQQRAFLHNIEQPSAKSRRLLSSVATMTVAGLVVGGLVGALFGTTRAAARFPGP